MNIDDTVSIMRKILENEGDIPSKLLVSQQLIALKLQTWCQLIAMTQPFISTVICSSCLIYIFMKININIRTKKKNAKKIKGYTYKITNITAANCPKVANIILNLSLCITNLPSGKI